MTLATVGRYRPVLRGLTHVLPRPVLPPTAAIHEVRSVGTGYLCIAAACRFHTRSLAEVCAHVAWRQYQVGEWIAEPPRPGGVTGVMLGGLEDVG